MASQAIILAAGIGARIAPFSYERPKALLEVRGEVLIERQIRQLQAAGVSKIAVVVGYMSESLMYLEQKFGVDILVSEDYLTRNNHASLLLARDYLADSFVISADQYYENNVFELACEGTTCVVSLVQRVQNERFVELDDMGCVTSSYVGEGSGFCVRGPIYVAAKDAPALASLIEREFDAPETAEKLWEQFLFDHLDKFKVVARRIEASAIWEFDSFNDLCAFDTDFMLNVDSRIIDNICRVFMCSREAIGKVAPISEGLTNLSFLFEIDGAAYVYRHPGNGTDAIINRAAEEHSLRIAKKLGLDNTFIFEDPQQGWKISRFIPGCVPFDYENEAHVVQALGIARALHTSGETSPWSFEPYAEALKIERLLEEAAYPMPAGFGELAETIARVAACVAGEETEPVLCHNDFYGPNFLVHEAGMDLIDWEYSAMSDYACDFGNFISQGSGYSPERAAEVLDFYFDRKPTPAEVKHCMAYVAIVGYYWYVWAMYKDLQGNPVGEWIDIWRRAAEEFSAYAADLYGCVQTASSVGALTYDEFIELRDRYNAGTISADEIALLEPYRAKRAVLLASGFGSRMLPITVNTPKPLVRVNGRRIIESILDALLAAGVEEIVIVRGYLAEEFNVLLEKYPMIHFVTNPIYDSTNNISSVVAVLAERPHAFENAYAFESDLYLKNPDVIQRYQWQSNYLGVAVDETPDWCFDVEDGMIADLHKGGKDCYHMYGVSYWTARDGAQLAQDMPEAFNEDDATKQRFWDDVPCVLRRENYEVAIRECTFDDIDEIDSFDELCELDPAYRVG